MDKYNEYLAVHVLNEKEIVTYRTLSRALKVHVNLAKQMLWDFHTTRNTKKPGSVHATYLLSGQRKTKPSTSTKSTQSKDGDDIVMGSSPPLPGSSMPQQAESQGAEGTSTTKSILLVKEEHLDKAKATFAELIGIHVYSLQAEGLGDFQSLTHCTRKIFELLRTEDPLLSGKQYGTIQNAFVKRRSQKTQIPAASGAKSVSAKPVTPTTTAKKEADKPKTAEPPSQPDPASKATKDKPATLKRQGSSIMASFAKNAGKPKAKQAPVAPEKAQTDKEDTAMGNMSEDDADEGIEAEIDVKAPTGKSKHDRQAELEAMMDVDEEEASQPEPESEAEAEAEAEAEPVEEAAAAMPETEEPKETATVENGRRRGRRRIFKKRTVRDEEGYLVTKEEAVWESFSEDEPAPKKAKTAPSASLPANSTKKGSGRPGQGNIMSFFSKK